MAGPPPTAFLPPRTVPVFRVQKGIWREYLLSGNAMQITVIAPPAQAATAQTTVAGQLYIDGSVTQFPPVITVQLIQRGAIKGTNAVSVDLTTGAFTTTFPANTMTAGNAATAKILCALPAATAVSGSFNVT